MPHKPPIALRRPPAPTPADPAAIESFITRGPERSDLQTPGHLDTQEPRNPISEPKGPGLVRRASGKVRRRMTVYLPPELAQALVIRSATLGVEVSDIVATAVATHLEER